MAVDDLIKPTRFVVDETGRRTGIILDIDDWSRLVALVEAAVDTRMAKDALEELATAGGDARDAGWLEWQSVRRDWLEGDDAAGA